MTDSHRIGTSMRVAVTGGAGFIGSHVVDRLLHDGHAVVVLDNLSTGHEEFLQDARADTSFEAVQIDLFHQPHELLSILEGIDAVVHLAANADVRFGWTEPRRDLEQNIIATHNVLEAMRVTGVNRILFSSTGSIYGDTTTIPTPEDGPFPSQTSLYGASKLGAEALIQAYTEGTPISATIFRFVSILGPRYTHGHVLDFFAKLRRDPSRLEILGNGEQRKSYLHVMDCVEALTQHIAADHRCEVFNLGVDSYCTVTESAGWISERLGLDPEFHYTGGDRGWIGDNPFIYLDTSKIRATGWSPRHTIREAVEETVDYLVANPAIVDQVAKRR